MALAIAFLVGADVAASAVTGAEVLLRGYTARGVYFDLRQYRGQVVALTFVSRYTRDEGARVNRALMTRARPGQSMVVSVIDFMGIPPFVRGYAKGKIAEHDYPGRMQYLVDESGSLHRLFQAEPDRHVDILVIDRDGSLAGRYVGDGGINSALHLVDQLKATDLLQ